MGTWDWDLATGRISWGGCHEELWCMPPGTFRGTYDEFNARIHPEDREALSAAVADALANKTEYNCEYRIVWPNGEIRWMGGRGHGIYDVDGKALRMMGIVMDVTERHEAETVREHTQNQLRDSEYRLRGILDSMFAFVGLFSTDGIVLEANRAPLAAARLKKEEVIGRRVVDTYWINHSPHTQAQLADAIARAARGETVRADLDVRVADGSLIVLDTTFGPLRDAEGKVIQVVGSGVDITARKHAEEMRQKLETQLWQAQKMEALGTLAGGVAHDFNNILNIIIGNAELAGQDLGDRQAATTSLDEIRKAGRRAKNIVQQILAYSRKQPMQRRALSMRTVINECAVMLRATLPSGADFQVICDDAPNVLADATQIHQVLINLGTNAFHALREDSPTRGMVQFHLRETFLSEIESAELDLPSGMYAELRVTDNGVGMDANTRGRIFEPFFTTKGPGKGTGLGLAVVEGIVRAHGGGVVVESTPGIGSTFTVLLPVDQGNPLATGRFPALQTRGHGQCLLYLDDDSALVSLAVKMLERANYQVVGFTDAAAALDAVRANPTGFAAAITDHTMPGASGLQVARLMMAIRPDLKVVLVSGYVTDDLRNRAIEAGVKLVASKPDSSEELCALVEQALGE